MDDKVDLMNIQGKCNVADEFAKQLHEQYAVSDNAKTTNVISFIAAIAFVFIGFGYVYIQPYLSKEEIAIDYSSLLLYADILANIVFVLLTILCVSFGYSTRRDHVVITRIRNQYASKYLYDWFNGKFNGCGKSLLNYLPNYYMIMFVFIQIFIFTLALGCARNIGAQDISECSWYFIALLAVLINIGFLFYNFCKYILFLKEGEK